MWHARWPSVSTLSLPTQEERKRNEEEEKEQKKERKGNKDERAHLFLNCLDVKMTQITVIHVL